MRQAMATRTERRGLALGRKGSEVGTIRGYASLFGTADLVGDTVEPGAFSASIARRGVSGIRMLWQHDPGRPIGRWTSVSEDRDGLFVEGRLALSTAGGAEAFALIESGAVDGLSIGFRTKRAARGGGGGGRRRLVEIDLWEISVVTFPMQERARVTDIRTAASALAKAAAGILLGPKEAPRPAV